MEKKVSTRPINPKTGNWYTKSSKKYKEWVASLTPKELTEEEELQNKSKWERIFTDFKKAGLA